MTLSTSFRRALRCALVFSLAGCAGTPQPRSLDDASRLALADTLRAFASGVVDAISRHDVDAFLGAHADSPELVYADAGRFYPPKDSILRQFRAYFSMPAVRNLRFRLGEARVNVLDRDHGVVTGIIHSENTDSLGNVRRGQQAWSIVTVRRDGRWVIVQSHESYPRNR